MVIIAQRAKRLHDKHQAALRKLGLLDQQFLAFRFLLIGALSRRNQTFCELTKLLSSIFV